MSASAVLRALECSRGGCKCHGSARRGVGDTHCPAHSDEHPSCRVDEEGGKVLWNCKKGCSQDQVREALVERGLLHEIRDAEGNLVAWHERKGRWFQKDFTVGLGDVIKIKDYLYGLDQVLKTESEHVFIVEGEKARDALSRFGIQAVGTFGATTDPSEEVLQHLLPKRVYLFPDADKPGREQADRLGQVLVGLGAEAWRLNWSEAPAGGDAADLLEGVEDRPTAIARLKRLTEPALKLQRHRLNGVAPPTLERLGVGYRLTFPQARVEIHIPRIHWHKEDAVAVYRISTLPSSAGEATQRLDHGNLNLQSSRTRASLAKELGSRYEADWSSILEQASMAVLDSETSGEEPQELTSEDEELPSGALLGSLCLLRDPTMIFGHGGDFKSYLALAAGASIATGKPLLGLEPTEQRRVAYLDWEWDVSEHRSRLRKLLGRERIPGFLYFRCRLPLVQEVDRLAEQFRRHNIGYCIVDSVSWACGGAPEESGLATGFQQALRQLGVGSLCLAHINRKGDTSMPFGSVYWHASMRATWFLKKQQEVGEDTITLGLFNRKANGGRLEPPKGFRVNFGEDHTDLQVIDPGQVRELREGLPLVGKMIAVLKEVGKPLTYAELSEQTGVDIQLIRNKANQAKGPFVVMNQQGSRAKHVGLRAEQTGLQTSSKPVSDQTNQQTNRVAPQGNRFAGGVGPVLGGLEETEEEGGEPRVVLGGCPNCHAYDYKIQDGGLRTCLKCQRSWYPS